MQTTEYHLSNLSLIQKRQTLKFDNFGMNYDYYAFIKHLAQANIAPSKHLVAHKTQIFRRKR
ncbi:hypothetical protein N474_15085 [Pseudoalteromonas luteoviolacea CPMOR-2]|nr:hypothetical protein N474_15085 [Pseudoalteromonas luteoviolacea CPMOR-2]